MAVGKLLAPHRAVQMADGSVVHFFGDHLAWYTLEARTEKTLAQFFRLKDEETEEETEIESEEDLGLSHVYELAWALSARHRRDHNRAMQFEDFLSLLPTGEDWREFRGMLLELFLEAFPQDPEKKSLLPPGPAQT